MAAAVTSVIDLPAVHQACRPIVSCYERFLFEGRLDVHELDQALASLRRLPRLGGRLGRAVALLLAGGTGAPTEATLAALDLMRSTSGLHPSPAPALPSPGPSVSGEDIPRGESYHQPPLPGLS